MSVFVYCFPFQHCSTLSWFCVRGFFFIFALRFLARSTVRRRVPALLHESSATCHWEAVFAKEATSELSLEGGGSDLVRAALGQSRALGQLVGHIAKSVRLVATCTICTTSTLPAIPRLPMARCTTLNGSSSTCPKCVGSVFRRTSWSFVEAFRSKN